MKKEHFFAILLIIATVASIAFVACRKEDSAEPFPHISPKSDNAAVVSEIRINHGNRLEVYTPYDYSKSLWRWQVTQEDIYELDLITEIHRNNTIDSIQVSSSNTMTIFESNGNHWEYAIITDMKFFSDTLMFDITTSNGNQAAYMAIFNDHSYQEEFDSIVSLTNGTKSIEGIPWLKLIRLARKVFEEILLYHTIDDIADSNCEKLHAGAQKKCEEHLCGYERDAGCKGHCIKNETTPSIFDCSTVNP